jgi:hypothetical protein
MRKAIIFAALATMLFARRADACRDNRPCPIIVDVFAYTLAGAIVGGYAYGTGYYAVHDLTDDKQSMKYAAGEVAYNGLFGSLFTYGAVVSAKDGDVGEAVLFGSLGLAHDAMAVHGAWRIHEEWKDPGHAPDSLPQWIAGIGLTANTIVWTYGIGDDHGRAYGIVEAGVNAPIAAGLAYLAYDRARDRERGAALLYGGMAAISVGFTYHGLRTAISPDESPALDLLGTNVMPTAVSDGREVAPGLAMSGVF